MRDNLLVATMLAMTACGTTEVPEMAPLENPELNLAQPFLAGQIGDRDFAGQAEVTVIGNSIRILTRNDDSEGFIMMSSGNFGTLEEGQYNYSALPGEGDATGVRVLVCAGPADEVYGTSTDYDTEATNTNLLVTIDDAGATHFDVTTDTSDPYDPFEPNDIVQASFDLNLEPDSI